jgi:hypothetical protein
MRDPMNPVEQRSFEFSIRAYRELVRIYPKEFLHQFEDSLVQTFGDLARRALKSGGFLQLLVLWMRVLPDLGISAIREHLNVSSWTCPSHIRLRWIAACSLGFLLGGFAGDLIGRLFTPFNGQARSVGFIVLGILQAAWALKRPAREALRWGVATAVGCFALALPFRSLLNGFPPNRLSFGNEVIFYLLFGVGIGLLQFLLLPKASFRAWRWIPAMALGVLGGRFASIAGVYISNSFWGYRLGLLIGGAILGTLTCIPLESILRSTDETKVEGATES